MTKIKERIRRKVREEYGYDDDVITAALCGALAGGILVGLMYRSAGAGKVSFPAGNVWLPRHIVEGVAQGAECILSGPGVPDMVLTLR